MSCFGYVTAIDQAPPAELELIFDNSIRANINWKDIEALFVALGAEISEGRCSKECASRYMMLKPFFTAPIRTKKQTKGLLNLFADF